MTSLTDRYVDAVTTQLPPAQREDIARELRATIEDAVEARPGDVDAAAAERAVLVGLGHPARLADSYRGEGRSLIGPRVYPAWLALLKLLLGIVPAVTGAVSLIVALSEGASGAAAVSGAVFTALGAAMQVVFWVTVAFVIVERTQTDVEALAPLTGEGAWEPEDLPDPASRRVTWGEGVTMIVMNAIGLAFVAAFAPTATVDGVDVPLLTSTAMVWRWVVVAGFAFALVVAASVLTRGRWTGPTAWGNLVANLLIGIPLVALLLMGDLLNPEAVWATLSEDVLRWGALNSRVAAAIIGVFLLWDSVDAFRGARRR